MPKNSQYQLDERDNQDFARALEEMYNVMVVVELRPSPSRVQGHWLVSATAYENVGDRSLPCFRGEEARFPGPNHASFSGALLWALTKLEMRLQAVVALKQLPFSFYDGVSPADKP